MRRLILLLLLIGLAACSQAEPEVEEYCVVSPPFSCVEYGYLDGKMYFEIENSGDTSIISLDAQIENCFYEEQDIADLLPGEPLVLAVDCPTRSDFFEGELVLGYRLAGTAFDRANILSFGSFTS